MADKSLADIDSRGMGESEVSSFTPKKPPTSSVASHYILSGSEAVRHKTGQETFRSTAGQTFLELYRCLELA